MEETSKSKRGRKPKAKEEQVKVEEPKKVEEQVKVEETKKEETKLPEPVASIPVVEEKITIEETGKEIGNKIENVNIFEFIWNSFINLFKNK